MSIFSELLPKINEISIAFTKNFNDDLKAAFDCFDKFEAEFQHGRTKAREKAQKDKNHMTTLQSIYEDEDDQNKVSDTQSDGTSGRSCAESNTDKPCRASKKRSKYEVDGLLSPEQDKRQKRNASVKAQTNITKQVNVNLTQKLRREDNDKKSTARRKEDDKENSEPLLNIEIKQEKISLPPEPEYFSAVESLPLNIETKQEPTNDDMAMPPPMAPVPKPRAKAAAEEKPAETSGQEETSGKRRTTRTRKQTDTAPASAASRSTRASSRSTKPSEPDEPLLPPPQPEPRPKRTRAKKKVSEVAEPEKETSTPVESLAASRSPRASSRSTKLSEPDEPVLPPPQPGPRPKRTRAKKKVSEVAEPEQETQTPIEGSPAEKPRPKRTRRGQKAAEKAEQNQEAVAPEPPISLKHEPVSQASSPTIPAKETKKRNKGLIKVEQETIGSTLDDVDAMDMTRLLGTVNDMDKTVVLPNGVYNHAPVTPKNVRAMNETVVIEAGARETIVISKPQIMDATVVLEKEQCSENISDDNSLLTDDSEMHTPPKQEPTQVQPTSAVKEKVQQFEELASRVTRTKTRAMAKKQEEEETDTHTPPDKIVKQILSVETLNKMNNMIFNGKQISSSATKPRSNIPTAKPVPATTSKLSGINKAREEAEARREKEDARKKKEAMLEAKREMHKRKREEKMAAAAAAREAAERSRRAAMEAAARERVEKQAHADLGKLERLKEAERKKVELARKVAETEERRRAEEIARQQRLAEEQRRADEARKKQLEEAAATKKEAALMTKEIEKRQKEYMEKQKMKQKKEDKIHTPLKNHGCTLEPAYMADGFQYLNSDEDEEPVERPVPDWSTYKARKQQLCFQSKVSSAHIDRLFSVRVHSPDLREIFPNIERARLKRTSSAVWRTPPARLPAVTE